MNKRRSPNLVDICDFNHVHLRETNASLNVKNYFLTKSPVLPMSFQDLRLVVTNRIPSNVVILPKTFSSSSSSSSSSSQTNINISKTHRKKMIKPTSFNVYRSLPRLSSHCSTNSERDLSPEELNLLTNSFTIDRISPLSHTGYFRTQNLPKISKSDENIKSNSRMSMHNFDHSEFFRSTPTNDYNIDEQNENRLKTPTDRTRKQLHIFMPTMNI